MKTNVHFNFYHSSGIGTERVNVTGKIWRKFLGAAHQINNSTIEWFSQKQTLAKTHFCSCQQAIPQQNVIHP